MSMHEVRVATESELYARAADALAERLAAVLVRQETAVLGIPGGRSAAGVFRELRERNVAWPQVRIFMADERLVPLDDPESNYRLARAELIDPLVERGVLPLENAVPFLADPAAGDAGVGAYMRELERRGGRYDVVLLSAGEDGHVASLFPGGSVTDEAPFFVLVEDSPKPPRRRMSMSRRLLERAQAAVLLFAGEEKRGAYERFRADEGSSVACPARIVRSLGDACVVRWF